MQEFFKGARKKYETQCQQQMLCAQVNVCMVVVYQLDAPMEKVLIWEETPDPAYDVRMTFYADVYHEMIGLGFLPLLRNRKLMGASQNAPSAKSIVGIHVPRTRQNMRTCTGEDCSFCISFGFYTQCPSIPAGWQIKFIGGKHDGEDYWHTNHELPVALRVAHVVLTKDKLAVHQKLNSKVVQGWVQRQVEYGTGNKTFVREARVEHGVVCDRYQTFVVCAHVCVRDLLPTTKKACRRCMG